MNASGPTKGEVVRPSDGKHPHSVVFIACVGSRDDQVGRPYCSRFCCMYTAKHAIMLKEHDPKVQTYVFYMDIRAAGRGYEEFVRRAQEEYGAVYLRGRVSKVYPSNGKMIVQGYDTLQGAPVEIEADLVVLAQGATSSKGAVDLMQTLGISYDQYGFINEMHPKLKPVETNTDGIYLAGCSSGPKDIPDTVAAAGAAAAKAMGLLSQEFIVTEPMVATRGPDQVRGLLALRGRLPLPRAGARDPAQRQGGGQDQREHLQGLRHLRGRLPRQVHHPQGLHRPAAAQRAGRPDEAAGAGGGGGELGQAGGSAQDLDSEPVGARRGQRAGIRVCFPALPDADAAIRTDVANAALRRGDAGEL